MSLFQDIQASEIAFPVFDLKNKWMLITAGKDGKTNTMTASWGGFGIMWNKEVAFIVIRPQRYTQEIVKNTDAFSLSFFDKSFLKTLNYLGTVSGRDEDKIKKSGLNLQFENNIPYFDEAETVVFVKKLFVQEIKEDAFLATELIEKWYPNKDFHYLYIAEITNVISKIKL